MLSKPKSLVVVKRLLKTWPAEFTQNGVSAATRVSVSHVNGIIRTLGRKFIVSSPPYKLTEPRKLLLTLAAESSMAERLYAAYELPGEKADIEKKLAKEFGGKISYAFTLLSALPITTATTPASHLAQGRQVSLYVDEKQLEQADGVIRKLGGSNSSIGNVQVFTANEGTLKDREKTKLGYCASFEQLLIDLYASPALLYVGQELLASKEG